ncbi:ABC transporter substrate-binding protein [Pseudomonas fluorescens]|uniref:DUF2076 domain-containing protein n=1 Tax=Pseudomonas lactucae TaxID=2813360 RepID=A0A9X1C826_9PSED|nr:DUF2076 domain-containing protein [Pseudomonas lactucae]OPA84809.1 ABC transporter substrate-binding protein [Pseudomonas fluorescens]MBN2978337.1 DUF2076 domain-containing protein [Pseudomonas lactucae]MBN2989381.1 DUF2076 domain-containing protein [Pseudomonas lactucae]OPB05106.1 ABC transporter substrate-binding protein [Pseudomonas fluorescens]OPB16178.1 ABC transporter substrate-binding protein [Pseudomonas fluorescens]
MNSEEQTLIDGLFSRLQQAETDSAPRDAQAEARIKEHMTRQPAAGYYMTQSILVQEHALKSLDAQNKQQAQQIEQLQDELQRAKSAQSAAPSGGGFLSSIFGGGPREAQPAPSNTGGGWREPARPSFSQPAPQQNYQQPLQQPPQQPAAAAPVGSGFLGGAMKTAAGVAGGVLLAEGISSLFHHNQQPQVVEEIIEQPAPASDQGGWGNDDQKYAGNDSWGGNSADSFADSDYSDDSSSFGDDDSFV